MNKKEEFLQRILATFKLEAQENIDSIYSNLIKLEKEDSDSEKSELIELIYRSAHSLKGASRAVNLVDIERVCHAFEDVMSAVRNEEISLNTRVFDCLHKTVDIISSLLNNSGSEDDELSEKVSGQIEQLSSIELGDCGEYICEEKISIDNCSHIEAQDEIDNIVEITPVDNKEIIYKGKKEKESISASNDTKSALSSTIRVANNKLDNLLFQTEELLEIKLAAIERKANLKTVVDKLCMWEREYENYFPKLQSVKRKVEDSSTESIDIKKDDIAEIIDFLEWAGSSVREMNMDLSSLYKLAEVNGYNTSVKIDSLMKDVKNIITVPFSSLLDSFPKMLRDVSKDLGKNIDFDIIGDDIEIDRRVLEKVKDPLRHILRNAVDYGIESSSERIKKSKAFKGKITVKVERLESNNVRLVVEDDGKGIDIDKIKGIIAVNEGIEQLEKISTQDCLDYIFKSGISTSDIVTDISGRGIGLAIAWDNVDQLGGTIRVETQKDMFSRFILNLPSSLVTYRGVVTEVSGNKFIVPTSKVKKVVRINRYDIKTIENKDTFSYEGKIIPVVILADILMLEKGNYFSENKDILLIVLNNGGKDIAFAVDSIEGEQEVLVKKFNRQLSRVRYISGATILGSGKVVPILNISDILKSAFSYSGSRSIDDNSNSDSVVGKKSILIVEDSVTSRMLLKNILESSGYTVDTAIDGIDGYTRLKEKNFDAVVSDVEMPRMNGFELTEKIRKDDETKSIPIVLVTSLSKREHKERGIDVGANAYIVKSSFDHSNLLEILDRLI